MHPRGAVRLRRICHVVVLFTLACEREREPAPADVARSHGRAATDEPKQREEDVEPRARAEDAPRGKAARRRRDLGREGDPSQPDGREVLVQGSPRAPSTGFAGVPAPPFASPLPSAVVPPIPSPAARGGALGARSGNLLPAPAASLPSGTTAPVLGGTATAPPFSMPLGGAPSFSVR